MTTLFDIEVTLGTSIRSNAVYRGKLDREAMMQHTVFDGNPDNKDGRYLCPGLMSEDMRKKMYVEKCTIIAMDIDTMTPKAANRLRFLAEDSGYEHLIYTTTQHITESPRYRILFNPSRVMTVVEYECVVVNLAKKLAIDVLDPCSWNPSQPAFLPMCLASNKDQAFSQYTEGGYVDVDEMCANIADFAKPQGESLHGRTLDPLPVPGALCESTWLACIYEAYSPVGLSYYDWLYAGFAIHHQTYGRQFDTWFNWSAKNKEKHCRKIGKHLMQYKWKSAKADIKRKGLTLRYILNQRDQYGISYNARAYAMMYEHCTKETQVEALTSDIRDDEFLSFADIKSLAQPLRKISYKLSKVKPTTGEAMVRLRNDMQPTEPKNYFYDRYLFNKVESQYYDIETKEQIPITSMNYMYGHKMPPNGSGDHKVVHRVLTTETNGFVKPRLMSGHRYAVHGEQVLVENGKYYLNAFDPDSWPVVTQPWNPETNLTDKRIEEMMHLHFSLICNGDKDIIRFLHQHLGHLRQRPMDRMHFAYAISSHHHGVGKSTLRKLYAATLGAAQTKVITAEEIADKKFNSFAGAPVLMSFIEEFEFDSRREQNTAIKRMKDIITSDVVSLQRKFKDPINAPAYTAYAIFSNDEYVLGHEANGRRWVPIICESVTKEQCMDVLGEDDLTFYHRYHELLDNHGDRFAAYFDQISLENFDKQNPPSGIKTTVFKDSIPAARMKRILEEILDERVTYNITADYASASAMYLEARARIEYTTSSDADALKHNDARALRNLVNLALRMMGYKQVLKQGGNKRVRMPFTDSQRTRLDEIWVKDIEKYGGTAGAARLRRHIEKVAANFEPPKQSQKVVGMDGQPYDF